MAEAWREKGFRAIAYNTDIGLLQDRCAAPWRGCVPARGNAKPRDRVGLSSRAKRSNLVGTRRLLTERDCFVAALLAMTGLSNLVPAQPQPRSTSSMR